MTYSVFNRCEWRNERCGPDDFIPTLTDAGLCYIFNQNSSLSTDNPGSDGGLRLVLSLEPWDYIRGPRGTIGALIYIHDQSEFPTLTTSRGVSIASGTWTSIGLEKTRETSLAAPHGNCEDTLLKELPLGTQYTTTNCIINNLYRYIQKTCGCRHFFMPSMPNTSYCTFSELIGCVKDRLDKMDNATPISNCTSPCNVTRYDLILSEVDMSKRYTITSRLEDQRDNSDWPDNPDENPIYVQSWALLNEINPRFTDDISTLADLLEHIYHLSNKIITDFPIFQDALNTSDLYQTFDDFRFNLKLRTNIQIGSKSCTHSANLKGCLTAFIAAEQVINTNAIKTCSVSEGFFYDIKEHFGNFEEAVSMYVEGSATETNKREIFHGP
ncbi:acid-sensing ion channel 2-like [Haliotis rubra]|uniref:acid-sensing ion channel 2-like n=1 Tax=Haliotis rubra TaxID=36100 RepID=UPI001EE568F7|nr:acid-sensing ion channel 2-like [Haliotis rubra]